MSERTRTSEAGSASGGEVVGKVEAEGSSCDAVGNGDEVGTIGMVVEDVPGAAGPAVDPQAQAHRLERGRSQGLDWCRGRCRYRQGPRSPRVSHINVHSLDAYSLSSSVRISASVQGSFVVVQMR